MRLSTKLLLTICVPPALIWLVGMYVVKISQDQIRESIRTSAGAEVQSAQEEIDRVLQARIETWEEFVEQRKVIDAVMRSNRCLQEQEGLMDQLSAAWKDPEKRGSLPAGSVDETLMDELGATLVKMSEFSGGIRIFREVVLTNAFGGIVAESGRGEDYFHGTASWWKITKAQGRYLGPVRVERDEKGVEVVIIDFCRRVEDSAGRFLGVLKVDINLDEVLEIVDSHARRGGRNRGMVLLNREAELIRIGGRGETRTLSDGSRYLVQNADKNEAGGQFFEGEMPAGEQVFTYSRPSDEGLMHTLGWMAVHTAETDALLAPVRQLRNSVILAAAVGTFLGVAIMLWVVLPVSWRMVRLVEATKQFGKGSQDVPIPVVGHDEISELSHEFNQMRTRLGETQENLREAMEQAKEASKAKGDFLANMSHEIRTPMNAIMGITELTLGTELTEEQLHYQVLVEQSAHSLLMVLNDILDYSKIEAGKLELEDRDFDLRDSVGDILHTMSPRAVEKHIELVLRVGRDVPRILTGDLTRLRQVIVNLVGNALKFTDSGEVVLVVERVKEIKGRVEILFEVRDTGIGVRADRLEKIFEVFAQADSSTTREFGGSGLGLAISKRIVKKMGGEIWAESVIGEGSVFRFTVLLERGSEKWDKERDFLEPLEGLEVLVVEDNATQLETLGEMLKSWGLEPILCSDVAAAFGVLKRKEEIAGDVKLMIVDRVLGEADGIELATRIHARSRWKSLPMILLTSVSDGLPEKEFNEVGISKVVNKPIKQSPLLDAVMLATGLGTRKPKKGRRESRGRERAVESMSILLAEDGKVNQLVAVRLLERRGHRVTVVENGKEAVNQSLKQKFDVILMDIQMPVMSGYEACREIRELEKKTESRVAIVAMTAHAMPGDREECLGVGMDDYISKPIESEEFYEVIEKYGSIDKGGEEIATTARGDLNEKRHPQGGEKEFDRAIFDPEAFSQRIGDEALMRELILIFEEEMEAMWISLQEAEERQDMKSIYESAHRLKGLVGNFCARRAWEYATKLNDRAKTGSHSDEVSESVEGFERELRLLESSLCDFRETLENKVNSL